MVQFSHLCLVYTFCDIVIIYANNVLIIYAYSVPISEKKLPSSVGNHRWIVQIVQVLSILLLVSPSHNLQDL